MKQLAKKIKIILISTLLVTVSFGPILHTHSIDLKPTDNCSACFLSSTAQTSIESNTIDSDIDLHLRSTFVTIILTPLKSANYYSSFKNKSPPC